MSDTLRPANITELSDITDPYSFEITPFDRMRNSMVWQGTTQNILDDLQPTVTRQRAGLPLESGFWHLPRLTRAVIDSEVAGSSRIELISEVTRFALQVYATGHDAAGFEKVAGLLGSHGLLTEYIVQPRDPATLLTSMPFHSALAAQRLKAKLEEAAYNKPLLMLPIGHGGTAAGLSVALKTGQFRADNDIQVYPIRFSRAKTGDTKPHLSDTEMALISANARDRTVVVCDEDSITGHTIGGLVAYLRRQLPQDSTILGIANNDGRIDETDKAAQGTWWEKYHS